MALTLRTRLVTLTLLAAVAATPHLVAQTKKPAKPAAAAPAPPPGPPPEISVVGVRVIGAGLGKNREEIRAFNERPGIAVALAIKMPAGQGIVELDEDNCLLTSVTDDAGTDLGEQAEYGSFPKTSEDGSVGLIEIESRLRPAATATAIMAEGTLVFSASPGSKPTKIPNVKLEKGKTFKLGTATVTLTEVTPGEDTAIELGLPRSVLYSIRDVRFLKADGTALEADRTSRGYMNDDASIGYRIKGAGPAVTIEVDMWQGLREQKVPFKIKTGLALK
ncbi:MAG: hypothetical protein ABIT71_17125 [Vicinamibacteraceae bacterium]